MAVFPHAGAWGSDNFNDPTTGLPITSGTPVTVTLPGINTPVQLWNDRNRTVAVANPTIVGANGNLRFYTDDPGDFDVHCNGQVLRVTATPFPGDTTGSSSGGLTADQVAAMLTGAAPITVSYSDASSGGTGLVTIGDAGSAGGSVNYNVDSSVTASDGTDPPLDTTLATHAYANRGDDIVMTVRDLRYSSDESVQVAHTAGNPVDLPLTPSTVVGRGPTGGIVAYPMSSLGGPGGGNALTIFWDAGDTALLGAPLLFSHLASDSVSTSTGFAKSIVSSAAPISGSLAGPPRLHIAPAAGLTGASTHMVYPLVGRDSADSEICSLWYGRVAPGQIGHVHRLQINPATGRPWGYFVWHDVTFGADWTMNLNTWTTTGALPTLNLSQGSANGSGQTQIDTLIDFVDVVGSRQQGTAVTLFTAGAHDTKVGDDIAVMTDTAGLLGGNFEQAVVTAVTALSVSYTSAVNQTSWDTGALRYQKLLSMPYYVKSRLEGTILRAKAWRRGQPEPDWSDELGAVRMVGTGATGPAAGVVGSPGLYFGHLPDSSTYCEVGSLTHTILG